MPKRDKIVKLFRSNRDKETLPSHYKGSSSIRNEPPSAQEEHKVDKPKALPPEISTIKPPPKSCWNRAIIILEKEHKEKYTELITVTSEVGERTMEPAMVIAAAEIEAQKLDANDWRTRRITRQALGTMTSLEKVFKALALLDATGGSTIAYAGVFAVAQMALVDMKQYQFALTCVANVSSTIERWIHFEERDFSSMDPNLLEIEQKLKDSLTDLYLDILIHLATMAAYCRKSNFARFAGALAPEIEDWKSQFEEIKKKEESCKNYRDVMEGEKNFQQRNSELLQWISPIDSSYEHENVLASTKVDIEYSHCGQWLLDSDEFVKWRGASGPSILWLRGTVGTGKTTLMARVLQELKGNSSNNSRLVFHYCSKIQAGKIRVDHTSILRSMVRQMSWVPDTASVASPINDIYHRLKRNRPQEGNLSSRDCEGLIQAILQQAQSSHSRSFQIVIDALDECEEPESLLKSLRTATKDCNNVHFMLSSRPNVRVHAFLPAAVPVDLEAVRSLEDMIFFVTNEIEQRDQRLLSGKAPHMEEQLSTLLSNEANGMFRWTQMQLEDFLSSSARKPRLRTEREVSIKLENLRNRAGMQTLDEEYERVYDENTLPGFESREHAVSAYKLLLCCVEPLSLNALAAAVAVQKGGTLHPEVTDTYILEICSNFIVIVDGYVRFAHPSAKEYLEHRGTGEIQEFGVEQQHLQAALTCLHRIENSYIGILDCWPAIRSWQKQWPDDIRFRGALPDEAPADLDELLLSLQGLLCPEPLMGSTDDSLMRELRSKRAYFTVYACYYWAYHTAKVSSAGREKEGITQEVADFMCSPLYQDWFIIEAYLRRSLPFIEDSAEFRCYEKKMNDSCGTTGWGGRGWKDKKPEPGLLIATFGLVDLLRLTRIAEDFLLYASNYNGATALHLASKYGQSQFLEEYLKRYAGSLDLEVQDRFGWTPLLTAMMYEEVENVETISILLNYGADVSKRDQHGRTVFHHLVGEWISVARLQVLTDLTKTIFEPDHWQTLLVAENDQGETALHQALRLSHEALRLGNEALRLSREAIFAVLFGEISDGILYRQWLTHTGDLLGISLLLTASRENCTKSLQLILQSGVPVNAAISASGVTALHVAATVEIAETLLQLDKSLLSRRDALGMTPLLSACKSTKPELCHFLLEHGADAKALDANGQSALHLWVQDQSWTPLDPIMSLLEVLIPECAGLTDPEGNTALHLIGYPSYGFGGRWWNGLVLKLLAAGEGLSTLNNKGKMAAQRLFQCLAWRFYDGKYRDDFDSYIFSWNGEQPAVWKIIIHMMKELRQAEAATRLSDEHLDLLYFYCHRLIEVSEYSNGKAEALLRERATQEDQLLLDCIQTQKASGWELPTSRNIYCLDRFGHEQRLRTA